MFILKFATLNINGINDNLKQIKLVEYLRHNGIQIAAIQEHNIKLLSKLEYLNKYYHLLLNKSILLKGGTLTIIDRRLPISIGRVYLHPTSRICTAHITIFNVKLYIVNIYAPSGKSKETEREALFNNELKHLLVSNTDNLILSGDWNSVLMKKDATNIQNTSLSKSLKSIVTSFKFKDIYSNSNCQPEFTYYRNNYAARLDRIYLSKLSNCISEVKTQSASFSDHLCVTVSLQISEQIKVDRPLWKLNTSLLSNTLVKHNFQALYQHLRGKKRYSQSTSLWWEDLIKPNIKKYFAVQGKEESKNKYGMLNYLEYKLRSQYEIANTSGTINKVLIDSIKARIDSIRDDMAKGVKVRTRLQDTLCGENISNYLIAKQKEIASNKTITCLTTENDIILNNHQDIHRHASDFYKKLYSKANCNIEKQNHFLSFVNNELNDEDREMLSAPLTKEEIYLIIKDISTNKTPGIDGIPIEFYIEFWPDISDDLLDMFNNVLHTGMLTLSQRRAIINIIPKNLDSTYITNFRPISLLCVDYKILSKLISQRMKHIICKIIYSKQFCAVKGRNINQCNMELRDVIVYANQQNLELAILNLDWYKAFDTVSMDFVLKILDKFGFGQMFIEWISTLYNGIESTLSVNNILGEYFSVSRSVRQGCPLSMALFIIYQEPFYRALTSSQIIRPLSIPGNIQLTLAGYADDTNVIVTDIDSLLEISNIISDFELATCSKLNRNKKTKIFGVGQWKDRRQWPLSWLKTEEGFLYTLGIYHGNDYEATIEKNCSLLFNKIKSHTQVLFNRRLSLFQRAAYVNSCILSKVWYLSHIYPISEPYSKEINRTVFNYVWCGKYEPIRRTTLFKPKCKGGLGLVNCALKSKTLLANSFLKSYCNDENQNSLMIHYCFIKMNNVIPKTFSIHNASLTSPPYYQEIMKLCDKFLNCPTFPILDNNKMYMSMLNTEKPVVEIQYPLSNWRNIWTNFCSLKTDPFDKDIIFKHLHVRLATNSRLAMMDLINSNTCNLCNDVVEQTALHMLYECTYISPFYQWFLNILMQICNFKPSSNIRFLYFWCIF